MEKFTSRKWWLAVFYALVSTVALFTGFMDGGQYVILGGTVLGLYNAANYLGKRYVDKSD